MISYEINLSNQFREELDNIYNYICFYLGSPQTANKIYHKTKNSILSLTFYPERYSKISSIGDFRKLLINHYVVIYQINNSSSQVFILHIFHGSQNYLNNL